MKRHHGFAHLENVYAEGLHLYDNGDLLVGYQADNTFPYSVGLAKFDKDAKLLWRKESFTRHWFFVDRQRLIYASSHEFIDTPLPIVGTAVTLHAKSEKSMKTSYLF
jgi:hypothetical protein